MKYYKVTYRQAFFYLSILLLLAGCHKKEETPTVQPPVKVSVMSVSEATANNSQEYSGTVSSAESTTVSFSVPGTIIELYCKEGQKVSKGQLLGKVRNGEYINAYNIAKAQLEEAQDGYERLKILHDANALPEIKWVEIQQKVKQAKNMEEMAQRTLSDANLHSPVSGTITQKFADTGQTVIPAQPIYEIISTGNLTIDIPVSENEIGNFHLGETAKITFDIDSLNTIEGKVIQKAVAADPLTRTYTIKISIPNQDGKILPGMIGKVIFSHSEANKEGEKAVILPSQSVLLNEDNRWFVWVVKDNVAERRFVTTGKLTSDGLEIISGLNPNDSVIVKGMQKVGSGSKVISIKQYKISGYSQ